MKQTFIKYLPVIMMIGVFFAPVLFDYLLAQPPGGPPNGGGGPAGSNPPCFQPPCIPIDGGLGFLVAAGVALGGKKIYNATYKKK